MALVLPKQLAYEPSLPSLPNDTTAREVVLQPSNGSSSYGPSSLIEFTLPSRGFLEPGSMYLRFKCVVTATTGLSSTGIRRGPYTLFQKLEEYAGSQQISQQNEYGLVMSDLVDLTMSQADKYGFQSAWGLTINNDVDDISFDYISTPLTTNTISLAIPLQCALNNCEKLYPLEFSPSYMIRLTTETVANAIQYAGTTNTLNYTLSNVELCYNSIEFNSDVINMVSQMGGQDGKFFVKSQSWACSSVSYGAGSGSRELTYGLRYSSIKSIFSHFQNSQDKTVNLNGKFDSRAPEDATGGTYQFTIDSVPYPQREISTTLNKAGAFIELRRAVGGITNKLNSCSISNKEFNYIDNSTATELNEPGKFIIGTNCERLPGSDTIMTGVSSNNANITLRVSAVNTNTITAYTYVNYDLLFEIDPQMKAVVARY